MKNYLLYFLLLLSSCGFEPEPSPIETIYPLPYLPVYPGSWWKYLDEDNDTVLHTTSSDYIEHSYKSISLNGNYTLPYKVPYWNNKPVYGYSSPIDVFPQHCPYNPCGAVQVGYLSENVGDRFYTETYKLVIYREVANTDTQIVVNGTLYNQVIRVNNFSYSSFYNQPLKLWGASFYARNIGLIQSEQYGDSVVVKLRLVDYFINK